MRQQQGALANSPSPLPPTAPGAVGGQTADLLLPRPQQIEVTAERVGLPIALHIDSRLPPLVVRQLVAPLRPLLGAALASLHLPGGSDYPAHHEESSEPGSAEAVPRITLSLLCSRPQRESLARQGAAPPPIDEQPAALQSYHLQMRAENWSIQAGGLAGVYYGVQTLVQWLRLHSSASLGELPLIEVIDAPAFATRGVMLDISRNKVPQLHTLLSIIDRLAACKINHLELYTEHTFAYRGHEEVWADWSPLTPADVEQIVAYCAERFIEVSANQNSFGHFHRWLVHARYRPLAECPEGVAHPFSREPEPFSLCPSDPGVPRLLGDLYDQLLEHFPSRRFNVGLDETLDLGLGRSSREVEERGRADVYLDFVQRVSELVTARGRRMMLWGDIILEHPELAGRLPHQALVLGWGYEADHDFARDCMRFSQAGVEHWVCPGTSTWNSLAGRVSNAFVNIGNAALAGARSEASGLLVTDWGDSGHLQPLVASGPGLMAAAAAAWSLQEAQLLSEEQPASRGRWSERLDWWWFDDPRPGLASALLAMGDYYRLATKEPTGSGPLNGSGLFHLLQHIEHDLTHRRFDSLSLEGLGEVLRSARLVKRGLALRPASLEVRELLWVAGLCELLAELGIARLACGRQHQVAALEPELRRDLARRLRTLQHRRRALWMQRNRVGGWQASRELFERAHAVLLGETPASGTRSAALDAEAVSCSDAAAHQDA